MINPSPDIILTSGRGQSRKRSFTSVDQRAQQNCSSRRYLRDFRQTLKKSEVLYLLALELACLTVELSLPRSPSV